MMRDEKLVGAGLVGVVAKGAGAFVGTAVVAGRKIGLCVRSTLTPEEGPSTQAAKKPVRVPAKPKPKRTGPKPASVRKRPKAVRARTQKKAARGKAPSPPESSEADK